jgi:hypothetical protein
MAIDLSTSLRDLLIEHIDGRPVPLRTYSRSTMMRSSSAPYQSVAALIKRGYLEARVGADGVPTETIITEKGRAALAAVLADMADAMRRIDAAAQERMSSTRKIGELIELLQQRRR